jgi:hypothetical protein
MNESKKCQIRRGKRIHDGAEDGYKTAVTKYAGRRYLNIDGNIILIYIYIYIYFQIVLSIWNPR